MCGICGIYNLDGAPIDRSLLVRMNDTMIHRGPDGSGIYIDRGIGLGHYLSAVSSNGPVNGRTTAKGLRWPPKVGLNLPVLRGKCFSENDHTS